MRPARTSHTYSALAIHLDHAACAARFPRSIEHPRSLPRPASRHRRSVYRRATGRAEALGMTRPGARTADGLGTIRSQPWRRAAPAVRRSRRADHRRLAPQKKEPHPPMPSPPTPGDGSRHAVPVDRCLVGWWKEKREQRQLRHLPSLLVWLQLQIGQANRSRKLAQRQAERPIDDRRTTPSRCATRPGRPPIIELQTLEARRIAFCAWGAFRSARRARPRQRKKSNSAMRKNDTPSRLRRRARHGRTAPPRPPNPCTPR